MDDGEWQEFYECLAHGDEEHKAWLRGMVQGFASVMEGRPVRVEKECEG